jgi:hypothetical protein
VEREKVVYKRRAIWRLDWMGKKQCKSGIFTLISIFLLVRNLKIRIQESRYKEVGCEQAAAKKWKIFCMLLAINFSFESGV